MSSGQTTARARACWSAQETPPQPGLPNSSRQAATVADNGLYPATAASQPWLQGRWNGAAAYDQNPSARASFGLYRSPLILLRENF